MNNFQAKKVIGILGYPLEHSISPIFQQAALDSMGIEASYETWSVLPENFQGFLDDIRMNNFIGANVTIPHKETVIGYLDELDPNAEKIGSVNTIVNRDGRLVGYNTDSYGFLRSVEKFCPQIDFPKQSVLLIGAGGASRAVLYSLIEKGVDSIIVANRRISRAKILAKQFSKGINVSTIGISNVELRSAAINSSFIVNCSSVGMKNGDSESVRLLDRSAIRSDCIVFDLVYNPVVTPLIQSATDAGANVIGGLDMLVFQGAASFKLWTGRRPDIDVMFEAAHKALAT